MNRMSRNRLPRVMKHYSPTGRSYHGRNLKRLRDTWDRNGSTSGPTPWKIYDDDDDDDDDDECEFVKLPNIKFHENLSVMNRGNSRGRTIKTKPVAAFWNFGGGKKKPLKICTSRVDRKDSSQAALSSHVSLTAMMSQVLAIWQCKFHNIFVCSLSGPY